MTTPNILCICALGLGVGAAHSSSAHTQAATTRAPTEDPSIRPFRINVPDQALADLRRRILATQWPEKETVTDQSQGVPLAMTQELARYWATDYDWRKVEAKLNALPQFTTTIDGLDIHFIHVRSKEKNALPAHHQPRMARLDHRAIEAHRPTDQSHGTWGERSRRIRCGDSVDAGLRVFRQADEHRLGPRAHGPSLGRADEAPRLHPLRRPGRRLGCVCRRPDGLAGTCGIARHPHQHAGHRSSRRRQGAPGRRPRRHPVFQPRNDAPTTSWYGRSSKSTTPGTWRSRPQTLYGIADSPVGLAAWLLDHNDADGQPAAAVVVGSGPDHERHGRTDP